MKIKKNKFGLKNIKNRPLVCVQGLGFVGAAMTVAVASSIDNKGHRLGYGGGYYDRFYKKNSKIKYIGLSYSFQHFKSLPYEKHDLKLNFILTENVFRQVND